MNPTQILEQLLRSLISSVKFQPPQVIRISADQKLSKEDEYYTESLELNRGLDVNQAISLLRCYYYNEFYQLGDLNATNGPFPSDGFNTVSQQIVPTREEMDSQWHRVTIPEYASASILLQKGVCRLLPEPGECISKGADYPEHFFVRSNERRNDDHWKYFRSRTPLSEPLREVKFYFNLSLDKAPDWAACLKSQLDRYQLPFELKYLKSDESRCDSGVLYVSADQVGPVLVALRGVYAAIRPFLQQRLPLFVRPLLLPDGQPTGIGFAESPDPEPGWGFMSFGQDRCHRIANEMLEVFKKEGVLPDGELNADHVIERLKKIGLENFYQNPGSTYVYPLQLFEGLPALTFPAVATDIFLQEAACIGYILCREAIWLSEKCCTWIGTDTRKPTYLNGLLADSDLKGRPGVAHFLRTLHEVVSEPLFQLTAQAAETGRYEAPVAFTSPLESKEFNVKYDTNLFAELCDFLTDPHLPDEREGRLNKLRGLFDQRPNPQSGLCQGLHLEDWAAVNKYSADNGWYDLLPGLDGLALLGFSYLYAYDPKLVPPEVRKAVAE